MTTVVDATADPARPSPRLPSPWPTRKGSPHKRPPCATACNPIAGDVDGYSPATVTRRHAWAALSLRLLDEGRRFCFLFHLADPTSNAICRRIGYQPAMDVDEHRFVHSEQHGS